MLELINILLRKICLSIKRTAQLYPVQFFLFTGMGLFPLPDPAGEGAFGLGDVAAVDGEPLRDGRAGRSAADVALGVGEPAHPAAGSRA